MIPLCATCGTPTRNVSDLDGKPLCPGCRRKPYRKPTLANLARSPGRPPKAPQCRICLAPEEVIMIGKEPNRFTQSSLAKGRCRDRAACESRQPSLFGGDA